MPEYFTLPELRDLPQLVDSARYPDERCEAAAAWAVGVIEREVGTSFVHRLVEGEVHDGGVVDLVLHQPFAQNTPALAATENGAATTATLRVRSGVLRKYGTASVPLAFAYGFANVAVTYEYGYSAVPPGDVKEAALQLTRAHLLETDADAWSADRVAELTNEIGGTAKNAAVDRDHPTGYPSIDAVIVAWRDKLDVFGFA